MEKVNTVTGTCTPDELGRTLVHEHLLVGYPGWQMDALAPPFKRSEAKKRSVEAMHRLQEFGVKTFLDPCPMDLGRDPEFMAEVAQASGMRIICTTGAYFEEQGLTYTFKNLPLDDITAIYEKEITEGIGQTGIKAGLIKIATGNHHVSEYERKLLIAAARAAKRCDVPLISHTQEGSCGLDQIEIVAAEGVPPHRLLVGHSDGIDDPAYHRQIVGSGSYIGFDRLGINVILPDEIRVKNIASLVKDGYGRHVCLSHDSNCGAWLGRPIFGPGQVFDPALIPTMMPDWTPTHLFERVIPMMRDAGIPDDAITTMTDENPARWVPRRGTRVVRGMSAGGDMQGTTIVVTGANSGIGKAAAAELARRGAHVVMTARDPQRGEAARDDVRRASGNEQVNLMLGDFASLASVRALAAQLDDLPKIDVLINNAGLMQIVRSETGDGFETTFQVNHLAPFLLTTLLVPKIRQTPGARIVNVASDAHTSGGALDFDDLQSKRRYMSFAVYGRSKLANILFTRELARRLAGSGVTSNCLHPGVVATAFGGDGDTGGLFSFGMKIARPFMITPEKGADTMVYLATSPDVAKTSGAYFVKRREKTPGRHARDDAAARRLWDESVRLTGAPALG